MSANILLTFPAVFLYSRTSREPGIIPIPSSFVTTKISFSEVFRKPAVSPASSIILSRARFLSWMRFYTVNSFYKIDRLLDGVPARRPLHFVQPDLLLHFRVGDDTGRYKSNIAPVSEQLKGEITFS